MQSLEKSIKELGGESELTDLQTHELVTLRARYNALSVTQAEHTLIRLKLTFCDQGEKSGRLLAWQLKILDTERAINTIISPNDDIRYLLTLS